VVIEKLKNRKKILEKKRKRKTLIDMTGLVNDLARKQIKAI